MTNTKTMRIAIEGTPTNMGYVLAKAAVSWPEDPVIVLDLYGEFWGQATNLKRDKGGVITADLTPDGDNVFPEVYCPVFGLSLDETAIQEDGTMSIVSATVRSINWGPIDPWATGIDDYDFEANAAPLGEE